MIKRNMGNFLPRIIRKYYKILEIPDNTKKIIEPFVGEGDLLSFIDKKNQY